MAWPPLHLVNWVMILESGLRFVGVASLKLLVVAVSAGIGVKSKSLKIFCKRTGFMHIASYWLAARLRLRRGLGSSLRFLLAAATGLLGLVVVIAVKYLFHI